MNSDEYLKALEEEGSVTVFSGKEAEKIQNIIDEEAENGRAATFRRLKEELDLTEFQLGRLMATF